MNPSAPQLTGSIRATEILNQLAEELAFVVPEQDTGLLPVNRFIMDLEELATQESPMEVSSGLQVARKWLDHILDGTGKFTTEAIHHFNEWHTWMSQVLTSWDKKTAMPSWPEKWSKPTPSSTLQPKSNTSFTTSPTGDEKSIILNLKDDAELLREFHGESLELLQNIEQGLIVLESNPSDAGGVEKGL